MRGLATVAIAITIAVVALAPEIHYHASLTGFNIWIRFWF